MGAGKSKYDLLTYITSSPLNVLNGAGDVVCTLVCDLEQGRHLRMKVVKTGGKQAEAEMRLITAVLDDYGIARRTTWKQNSRRETIKFQTVDGKRLYFEFRRGKVHAGVRGHWTLFVESDAGGYGYFNVDYVA